MTGRPCHRGTGGRNVGLARTAVSACARRHAAAAVVCEGSAERRGRQLPAPSSAPQAAATAAATTTRSARHGKEEISLEDAPQLSPLHVAIDTGTGTPPPPTRRRLHGHNDVDFGGGEHVSTSRDGSA